MLLKKTDDTNRKDIPYFGIGRNNTVKVTTLSKVIYRFNEIPLKLSVAFFIELEGNDFYLKTQETLISKTILKRKREPLESDSRLYYNNTVIKSVVVAQK